MKIVIDIPERLKEIADEYSKINNEELEDLTYYRMNGRLALFCISKGTPFPDDAKILTKEAYSDLCMKAAPDFESEEYINERINNYNKMLKSGILDCIMEKSQESEDKDE